MSNLSLFRNAIIAATLIISLGRAHAQPLQPVEVDSPPLPVEFIYKLGGVYFLAVEEIKEAQLTGFDLGGKKVFESGLLKARPLVWRLQDGQGKPIPNGDYLCVINVKDSDGDSYEFFGKLSQAARKVNFDPPAKIYDRGPVSEAIAFFKLATQLMPDNAETWYTYGAALRKQHEFVIDPSYAPEPFRPAGFVSSSLPSPFLSPSPPPPPPAPTASKSPRQRQAGSAKRTTVTIPDAPPADEEKPDPAAKKKREADLNAALKAFQKALELASDCDTKNIALRHLLGVCEDLGKEDLRRESMLKLAESECATNEMRARSYYTIGQRYWQCAYDLSTRYADRRADDPFHARNFSNPVDKQRFNDCVAKGLEYIERALAADPEYIDALLYKGLIYREKQKATRDEAERKRLGEEAQKIANRALDLQKEKERGVREGKQ